MEEQNHQTAMPANSKKGFNFKKLAWSLAILILIGATAFGIWYGADQQQKAEDVSKSKADLERQVQELNDYVKKLEAEEAEETSPEQQAPPEQQTDNQENTTTDEEMIKAAATSFCVGANFLNCKPVITKHSINNAAVQVTNGNNGEKRNLLVSKNDNGSWSAMLSSSQDLCQVGSGAPGLAELCGR